MLRGPDSKVWETRNWTEFSWGLLEIPLLYKSNKKVIQSKKKSKSIITQNELINMYNSLFFLKPFVAQDHIRKSSAQLETFISTKIIHLQKSTYICALMWSLCNHYCFFGQFNKTNPKYNFNSYNVANICYRKYKNTISIYLTTSTTSGKTSG